MTPLHLSSLSLLFGPVSFLKLLESEGESFPLSLKKLFSFFLFALYYQGVWGGKHRFSSPDGNAFADNQLRRGTVFGLKAPSTSPTGRGVVLRKAHGSAEEPGARAGGPKERAALGPSGPQPRGPASYVASRLCAPGYLGRVFAREIFPVDSSGGMSQAPGNRLTFPGCPGQNYPAWAPTPRPGPGPHGSVLPGCVRGMLLCAGATTLRLPSPRVSSRGPSGGAFPSAFVAQRPEWGTQMGRAGRAEAGRLAGSGERWAGCLQRALSLAHSRCRCCPRLRGRPAWLWNT